MAVDAIGVVATPGTDIPRNAGISQEDFLRILLTQLLSSVSKSSCVVRKQA
jgi:hypothetical protein